MKSAPLYSNLGPSNPGSCTATGGEQPGSPSPRLEAKHLEELSESHYAIRTTIKVLYYLKPQRLLLFLLPSFLLSFLPFVPSYLLITAE